MKRRDFLQLTAAGAALIALPTYAQSKVGSTDTVSGLSLPTERGSVLPTRGVITKSALPINSPTHGMRYQTPFRFGMGGTQIGNIFAPISEAQAQSNLQAAWDSGVRYFDTSPFYGYGLSEHRLGVFLQKQNRDDYIVSTKVGRILKASRGPLPNEGLWTSPLPFDYEYDFSAAGARRSVEDSLQRMGISSIDIVFIHDLSPDNAELPGTWQDHYKVAQKGAMVELEKMRDEGLIRAWGFGINTPNAAVLAAESDGPTPDIVLLACQYSLIDHEETLNRTFPALERKGISVVLGTPLSDGFLGGRSRYHFSPDIPDGAVEKRAQILKIADQFGIDIRTAALQFAAAPKIVSAIVPGSRIAGQVEANAQSMKVSIPAEFWQELRKQGLISENAPIPA